MAWEYLDNLKELTGTPCSFTNGITWNDFLSYIPSSGYPSTTGDVITLGNIGAYSYQAEYDGQTSITETSYGLKIEWYTNIYLSTGQSTGSFSVYVYQNNDWYGIAGLYGLMQKGSFRFAVNHELQQAVPVLVRSFYNSPWYTDFSTNLYIPQANRELLYQVLMNGIPSQYEWTPVSSVYGKLGTINLSKLKDINDGEPVTGASSSAVNLTDKSLINILVGNVIVDDNKVGVEYSIPSGTYEYIKLVYKQDSEPEDASDGTAIDLEIGDGVIGISGINDGNTYFFKIFTDINASQAYEFTTEKPVVPPEYESYIDIINGSGFWWKNWPNKNYYNANQEGMTIYPPTLLSWISNYDDYSYSFTPTAARSQYCYVCNIQDVYITSNNNVYSVNYVISGSQQAFLYNNNPGWLGNVFTNQTFATCYLGQNPDGTTMSTSGTLAQVLSWMSYRFRNVNIYVDNVCWSKVN